MASAPRKVSNRPHKSKQTRAPETSLRRKEKRQGGDNVDAAEHRAFEPVGSAVEGGEARYDHGGPEGAELQGGEDQVQGMAEQGAEEDKDGGDEQGDLDRGAQRDAHGEVHIVLVGDLDTHDVFGDVAHYGDEYDPYEELGDPVLFGQGLYGPDERLRDVGDGGRRYEQQHERSRSTERGFSLALYAASGAAEDVEQVQDVEHEHHDGHLDAQGGRARTGACEGEDGRQGERGGHDGQHRGVDAGDLGREVLDTVLEAPEEEARPEHEQHVTDDRTDDRSLHHGRQSRGEGEDGYDELRCVAEGGVEDAAYARARVMTEALRGLAEDPRQPDQGQGSCGEDQERGGMKELRDHHGHRERRRRAVGYLAEQCGPP